MEDEMLTIHKTLITDVIDHLDKALHQVDMHTEVEIAIRKLMDIYLEQVS